MLLEVLSGFSAAPQNKEKGFSLLLGKRRKRRRERAGSCPRTGIGGGFGHSWSWAVLPLAAAAFLVSLTRRRCPSQSNYLGLSNLSPGGGLPCEPLCVRAVHCCWQPVPPSCGMEIIPRNVKGINSPGKGR